MIRHYAVKKLKPGARPAPFWNEDTIWTLPPYIIGKFSGELAQVMLSAVQDYVIQRSFQEVKQSFDSAAFPNKKPS